jgi:hypothetical protein
MIDADRPLDIVQWPLLRAATYFERQQLDMDWEECKLQWPIIMRANDMTLAMFGNIRNDLANVEV